MIRFSSYVKPSFKSGVFVFRVMYILISKIKSQSSKPQLKTNNLPLLIFRVFSQGLNYTTAEGGEGKGKMTHEESNLTEVIYDIDNY